MDRFTVMFQDYTIDYEEYYNRRATWCSTDEWWTNDDFKWTSWIKWILFKPNILLKCALSELKWRNKLDAFNKLLRKMKIGW